MDTQHKQEWEEEFDEKFVGGFDAIAEDSAYLPQIKSFIHSLLTAKAEELLRESDKWVDSKNWEAVFPPRVRNEVKQELEHLIRTVLESKK